MICIDGSQGEGGGQVLRTSLALSLITGKPFRIEKIRANRKTPGLLRQHLTAVSAAAGIGRAAVEGDALGSSALTFVPGSVQGGEYAFAIGTAGSTMLVLQTILLPLLFTKESSTVQIEGGTHNPTSPPFDFIEQAYLPLLRAMGADVTIELVRPGFYPAGGGMVRIQIAPSMRLDPIAVEERGEIVRRQARAVVANLAWTIAQREVEVIGEELAWPQEMLEAHTVSGSAGPGNVVSVLVGSEHVTNIFSAFGERGVRAEAVGHKAAKQAKRFINSGAAVEEHLADQLLLPMAISGGGSFTTTPLSSHSMTNIDVIRAFLRVGIAVEPIRNGVVRVAVA
jgi:RNA 3'-terminal phosphate cyclase (ATP)